MADPTTINFTRGVPASESFPAAQLASAAENALRKHSSTILQYGPASGFLPMREWLAARYNVAVDNVLCSNGSLQIVEFLGAALLAPGDTVFVEEPSYDRTLTTLRKAGARVVGIPLQADGPDIDALEQALRIHHPRFFYVIPDFHHQFTLVLRTQDLGLSEYPWRGCGWLSPESSVLSPHDRFRLSSLPLYRGAQAADDLGDFVS